MCVSYDNAGCACALCLGGWVCVCVYVYMCIKGKISNQH